MKYLFAILFGTTALTGFGQQRIGADLNTQLNTLNFTAHYTKVVKGPLILSAGITGGYYGYGVNWGTQAQAEGGFGFGNAYPSYPDHHVDSSSYLLYATDTKGSGVGIFGGIGLYKEFANFHGIRLNVNQRFSWVRSNVRGLYRDFDVRRTINVYRNIWHPVGAVSVELYHTMRLTGRSTFYWGFKFPYYFSLDKGRFKPQVDRELFYKFMPDLSVGFTYAIGRCD